MANLLRGRDAPSGELPIPPEEMRALVGRTDPAAFDNASGALVYDFLTPDTYETVLDFGSGCGRIARQLIQQRPRPRRYVGIDLHRGMVEWCRRNLEPHAPGFRFEHHDVFHASFNPTSAARTLPFDLEEDAFTLVNAISVFTHLTQDQTEHYLRETSRVLRPDGVINGTWFLFDKVDFPMMQDFQNALYINELDPSNAVIFDRAWLRDKAREAGLIIVEVNQPAFRGFQWHVLMRPSESNAREAEWPDDLAAIGRRPPPLTPPGAAEIGLEE
jgi:SAM-dependent methyltransferase